MKIGIAFPATLPDNDGTFLLNWARRADAGPFSSLGVIDRVVYQNVDPLTTLAAAAAVTSRIRLLTNVLLAPLHSASLLAKQSASIDLLSGGRLTLGLGVGIREEDFLATNAPFHTRGAYFDQQLAQMARIWQGQALNDQVGAIGPRPIQAGGPEILIGALNPKPLHRLKMWGTGFIAAVFPVAYADQLYRLAEQVWQEADRPGRPRLLACAYYALGPNSTEAAIQAIMQFYGPEYGPTVASTLSSSKEQVHTTIQKFADIGTDELIFLPALSDPDQLSRLANVL
jgi:alkanesulfonate monooxygenase SsuD/methylene tetrahydromethanopterin reductase-like flavin-dependent oxidoreductase (luciferase family)